LRVILGAYCSYINIYLNIKCYESKSKKNIRQNQ
jgi:hypothetical protein